MQSDQDPIDFPRNPRQQKEEFFALRLVGTALLVIGLVARMSHWPYANELLLAGLVIWSAWNLLALFAGRRKKVWEQCYSIGRLALALALFLQIFLFSAYSLVAFGFAALVFVVGIVAAFRDKEPS